jgi:nicotinate-nucleotide adenylyltransferase
MKLAIFGGMLDPPTVAHLWMAQQIWETGLYTRVWVMPNCSGLSSKKENPTATIVRLTMCHLTFGPFIPKLGVSEFSIQYGLDYTYQVVNQLCKDFPNDDFTFYIGDWDITKFKEYGQIEEKIKEGHIHFVKIIRNIDSSLNFNSYTFDPEISFGLSSTVIRQRVADGKPITGLVLPEVEKLIYANKLYRKGGTNAKE